MPFIDQYNRLNASERKFIRRHPTTATQFFKDAVMAKSRAAQLFPNDLHNAKGDAFRHAFWSALMTKHAGLPYARTFGYAHEATPVMGGEMTQPRPEREMDQHNNAIGRMIGSNVNIREEDIEAEVLRALNSERLRIRP